MPRLAAFNFGARKFGFGSLFSSAAATEATYIEDVFSTYLYTGNGSTQTITNGIDLAGKGGLVWIKCRSAAYDNIVFDTARTTNPRALYTNLTNAAGYEDFNQTSTGFTVYGQTSTGQGAQTYVSWTFRKQPKFFDVVTYTGNGTSSNAISHALASQPAFIITKRTDSTGNWVVWHRTGTSWVYGYMNTTGSMPSAGAINSYVTSTQVDIGAVNAAGLENQNTSGASYVMYLFAHNAGGFGLSGTDNVISCGSFTTDGSGNATVNLGYEPQWIMTKRTDNTSNWIMQDNMRGLGVLNSTSAELRANTSQQEFDSTGINGNIFATGFNQTGLQVSATYIYIAIRRGPMKVPTSGTSVYNAIARTGTSAAATVTAGFPVDMVAIHMRNSTNNEYVADRLRGGGLSLEFCTTAAESDRSAGGITSMASNTGFSVGTYSDVNSSPNSYINWCFQRAPGFFDVVCYTGTGSVRTVTHNLGAVPQLIIIKGRDTSYYWPVYSFALGNQGALALNETSANKGPSGSFWDSTSPTTTNFTLGSFGQGNQSSATYVAYLFATCTNVSKVGVYNGTGTTQTINCGFTGGARFVLIKRTDSTGDWYVWDTARGIIAGNDPYLLLNSTAVEVTNTDYIDPVASGFELSSTAPAAINANGGTYIFLAIA